MVNKLFNEKMMFFYEGVGIIVVWGVIGFLFTSALLFAVAQALKACGWW
jgi:hypothetical protein